jgi:hypothetical protein
MFCGTCGKYVDDGVEICPNCGKSTKGIAQQHQQVGYPLSNLTAKLFGVLFEISLWFILVAGVITGGVSGAMSQRYSGDSSAQIVFFLGGTLLGAIAAFMTIILIGGLVSLFIKLVNNTEEIKNKLN